MSIIQDWKSTMERHIDSIKYFTQSNENLFTDFRNNQDERFDIGFNVFKITSDLYYRENFHSDIIKSLLDPNEKHLQQSRYLHIFIDLLNKCNPNNYLNRKDYRNTIVSREKNNIDILIVDRDSKKAIIIENKINNAVDQPRQIPKYYDKVQNEYIVESIVYLTLDTNKKPHKSDWTEKEIININPLLTLVPSYDRKHFNLYNNWIIPSIMESKDSESMFLLKQYGNLLKFLNTNTMDTVSLEKFYETLKENDNLKSSISIKNMLAELPEYLAIRIENKYKNICYPFKSVWRYQKTDAVFEAFEMENLYLKMDIWCSENGYKVHFWNPKDEDYDIKKNLTSLSSLSEFNYDNEKKNNVMKIFTFFEEDALFSFVDQLKVELKMLKN